MGATGGNWSDPAASSLLSARAVRDASRRALRLAEADELQHWRLDRDQLPAIAGYTLDTIRRTYPTLDIPFHARWRHFSAGGKDRWAALAAGAHWRDKAARARAAFDLAIVSVLLDAGAGPDWRYVEKDGAVFQRSEGLAVASLQMFAEGRFSADLRAPLRADAKRLAALTPEDLAAGFQIGGDNSLVGLEGRAALLNALGRACLAAPAVFAGEDDARPGGLFDHFAQGGHRIAAHDILAAVLVHLGAIWPSRLSIGGVALGDCWRHEKIGLTPLHKLSQWLSYSLIEPLGWGGVETLDVDGLTGLAEYRNGGLFVDFGALAPRDAGALALAHEVGSPLVVEWRALTVALLDETAALIRANLGLDAGALPLARVLEGGTWAAGRRIARERRADGGPPLRVVSDGTVF